MSMRVLVTPLDWGLGHATRCIPIIHTLLKFNCDIIIGGSGDSLLVLRREFPSLAYVELEPYRPVYSSSSSQVWKMAAQLLRFIRTINREHQQIKRITGTHNIDLIISDNRYGCWSGKVKSIFITHQINILLPRELRWMSGILAFFNHRQIRKFTHCWVPDWQGDRSLAGVLSAANNIPVTYIGPLSRFRTSRHSNKYYDLLVILSGPEPQRSMLEKLLWQQLKNTGRRALLVRGVDTSRSVEEMKELSNIEVMNLPGVKELQVAIDASDVIICRSGYSSIMDLYKTGGKVIFVPTPGQTEQEYLALYFKQKGIAFSSEQEDFNLEAALTESQKYRGFEGNEYGTDLLEAAIMNIIHTP